VKIGGNFLHFPFLFFFNILLFVHFMMVGAIQVSPCFDPAKQSPSLGWIVMDRGRIMNTVQGTNGS